MRTFTEEEVEEMMDKSIEHDGCKGCKYENCSMESKECLGCKQNAVDKYKRMTQGDRIRAMSDEELAEFMANKGGYIACCQCDFFNHDDEKCESPSGWNCTKGYAEALIHSWLQSEVEE